MERKDIYLDYTMMSDFLKCRRYFHIRHNMSLVPKTESTPLQYGQFMHRCLSRWYQMGNPDRMASAIKVWDDYQDQERDPIRTKWRGQETFMKYIKMYPEEMFSVVANEVPVEIKIGEEGLFAYWLVGKLDLVVNFAGFIYGLDHKTTSQLGDTFFNKFKPNLQMAGYDYYTSQTYGREAQGMMINAISTAKTAEVGGKVQLFARNITSFTTRDREEYPQIVLPVMREIALARKFVEETCHESEAVRKITVSSVFYPNFDACQTYGGCKYREVCLRHFDEKYLEENYQVSTWDPREVDE